MKEEKDFFETKRGKDLLKFLGFVIFFIIVIAYVNSPSKELKEKYYQHQKEIQKQLKSSSQKPEIKVKTFTEIKNEFLNSNYVIMANIKIKSTESQLLLQKSLDEVKGYYLKGSDNTQIKISNDIIYEVNNGEEKINKELLKDIKINFITGKGIMAEIEHVEPIISEEDNKRIFSYSLKEYKIMINIENDKLISVHITSLNEKNHEEYTLGITY
ncbi:MAG: hypothetical protein GX864_00900 [Mollicutes bacterium]|nr:hypothetical protein [Mollicutes bacterium]